jgi:hypothetical protein
LGLFRRSTSLSYRAGYPGSWKRDFGISLRNSFRKENPLSPTILSDRNVDEPREENFSNRKVMLITLAPEDILYSLYYVPHC